MNLVLEGDSEVGDNNLDANKDNSAGIYCNSSLTISGNGTLTAYGGVSNQTDRSSYGVFAPMVSVAGGTLTASGGQATNSSIGVYAGNILDVSGGTLTASGGQGSYSYGVYVWMTDLDVSGGTLTASGGKGHYSYGVHVGNILDVSGGTLTAQGGTGTIEKALNKAPKMDVDKAKIYVGETEPGSEWDKSKDLTNYKYVNIEFLDDDDSGSGGGSEGGDPSTNPGTDPTPSPSSSNSDSSRDSSTSYTTGVVASGSIYGSIDVFVLTPSATGAANEVVDSETYHELRQSVESGYTPIAAFEVKASHSGKLTLSFPVGEQYNGMQFVVKHKTSSGKIETYTGVVENGKVVITVNSLSPFMIAVKGANKNPNTGR